MAGLEFFNLDFIETISSLVGLKFGNCVVNFLFHKLFMYLYIFHFIIFYWFVVGLVIGSLLAKWALHLGLMPCLDYLFEQYFL